MFEVGEGVSYVVNGSREGKEGEVAKFEMFGREFDGILVLWVVTALVE